MNALDISRSDAVLSATYRGVVDPSDCNRMGHIGAVWYASRFDDASWEFLSLLGLSSSYFRRHNRFMAIVQQETTFNRALSAGDLIEIRSRTLEIRENALRVYHEMRHMETNETVAVSTSTEAHLDGATCKPCPLPPDIQRCFTRNNARMSPPALDHALPGQW